MNQTDEVKSDQSIDLFDNTPNGQINHIQQSKIADIDDLFDNDASNGPFNQK